MASSPVSKNNAPFVRSRRARGSAWISSMSLQRGFDVMDMPGPNLTALPTAHGRRAVAAQVAWNKKWTLPARILHRR